MVLPIKYHHRVATRDKTVLCTKLVELIAQTLSGFDRNSLYLVSWFIIKDEVGPPGALAGLSIGHLSILLAKADLR